MLRTNNDFLAYIQQLYSAQDRKETLIRKAFEKDRLLLQQDTEVPHVLVIESGITKCYFTEANDKDYILEFLGAGEIIGEIEAIRERRCLCNVQALTAVSAYAIALPHFRSLLKNDLQFNHLLLNAFAERIVNTSSRASFQQLYTVEHSLAKLLELQSAQQITLSKEDSASYLGINIRSLNRALKNLREE
jgi:CRP/FNR family transcriptional regulator, anaerobic regulatory protein